MCKHYDHDQQKLNKTQFLKHAAPQNILDKESVVTADHWHKLRPIQGAAAVQTAGFSLHLATVVTKALGPEQHNLISAYVTFL